MAQITEWFYNPLKGQPRYVDISKLRRIATSETISMKVKALIDATLSKPYRIKGKEAKRFFSKIDFNSQLRAFLEDLLVLDAGVFVKVFTAESYKKLDSGAYALRPLGKRKLVEIWARDGGSFLKEIDVSGIIYRYWQYSYLHDKVAPIEFNVGEVAYCERHPRSYSCYGWSELESLHWPTSILRRIFRIKPKLYDLNPETVQGLRQLIERTMNRDIMPEFGKGAKFQFNRLSVR